MVENEKKIPEVEFTFREEEKSPEEKEKEMAELLKKRNELLASMGFSVPSDDEIKIDEMNSDCPRPIR